MSESIFRVVEGPPGTFRVYVFNAGLYPTGTREDADRLVRSLEHELLQFRKADCFGTAAKLAEARARIRELEARPMTPEGEP